MVAAGCGSSIFQRHLSNCQVTQCSWQHSAARLSHHISESHWFSCAHPPQQRRVRRYHGVQISIDIPCKTLKRGILALILACVFTFAFSPSLKKSALWLGVLMQPRLRGRHLPVRKVGRLELSESPVKWPASLQSALRMVHSVYSEKSEKVFLTNACFRSKLAVKAHCAFGILWYIKGSTQSKMLLNVGANERRKGTGAVSGWPLWCNVSVSFRKSLTTCRLAPSCLEILVQQLWKIGILRNCVCCLGMDGFLCYITFACLRCTSCFADAITMRNVPYGKQTAHLFVLLYPIRVYGVNTLRPHLCYNSLWPFAVKCSCWPLPRQSFLRSHANIQKQGNSLAKTPLEHIRTLSSMGSTFTC